ncbi:MAG: leucine-rich repeat protein [Clostridia bacterium]|nr:leucine-rich repeat protein [Clostridia bacterium]
MNFSKTFEVPEEYNGKPVVEIGEDAFFDSIFLNEVVISGNVTSIGDRAFYRCNSLKSVVIGDSVTTIGDSAFSNCGNLNSIVIGDSVTTIGDSAFSNCGNLNSIVIGDSVTTIGDKAFYCTTFLRNITVGENNTAYKSIDGSLYTKDEKTLIHCAIAWYDTHFTVPEGVESIRDSAFDGNYYNLKSVVIPDSVTSIGDSAFSDCYNLTDIYYTGTESEWAAITVGTNNEELKYATIHYNYVPEE